MAKRRRVTRTISLMASRSSSTKHKAATEKTLSGREKEGIGGLPRPIEKRRRENHPVPQPASRTNSPGRWRSCRDPSGDQVPGSSLVHQRIELLDRDVLQDKVKQEGESIFIRSYSFCFSTASWNQGRTDPRRPCLLGQGGFTHFCGKELSQKNNPEISGPKKSHLRSLRKSVGTIRSRREHRHPCLRFEKCLRGIFQCFRFVNRHNPDMAPGWGELQCLLLCQDRCRMTLKSLCGYWIKI